MNIYHNNANKIKKKTANGESYFEPNMLWKSELPRGKLLKDTSPNLIECGVAKVGWPTSTWSDQWRQPAQNIVSSLRAENKIENLKICNTKIFQ